MHRYSAAGGSSSGVSGGGGPQARDSSRSSESSSSFQNPSTFPTIRRTAPLVPYKLRCERDPLSGRLGPPDFYPPTSNCAEEILNRESCQSGYKELIEGIEEPKEVTLTLTNNPTLWAKQSVNRYKESIHKRFRALNDALIRKRKAGQVYGVPLSGALLAKPGLYPEQKNCGEDFRKKWIEDLSQRKRLRALAEHVPHGYRKRAIFEAVIKHDVPLLRATWFVKIVTLNQVRSIPIGMSAGGPDKSQLKRVDLWTNNVVEYAQSLLDDLCLPGAVQAHPGFITAGGDPAEGEQELLSKWRYVVRLAQWHYSEGLLHRTQVIDWALKQLQEKETVEALELLLPIVLELIDGICLSQAHVRMLVDTCLRWLRKLFPTGIIPKATSELTRQRSVAVSLVELLRYLLLVVPDTFVALDCFPLPPCVCTAGVSQSFPEVSSLLPEDIERHVQPVPDSKNMGMKHRIGPTGPVAKQRNCCHRELAVGETVDLIQQRAASLARAVNPVFLRNNEGKVVQALDKALNGGDIAGAYRCVYEEDFCSSDNLPAEWQTEVISASAFSLSGPIDPSELFAVRFLCEWAVCDFRDSRGIVASKVERPQAAFRDTSCVYMVVSVLRNRMPEIEQKRSGFDNSIQKWACSEGDKGKQSGLHSMTSEGSGIHANERVSVTSGYLLSPGCMHDLLYAWLDQHEMWRGDTSDRLPLLLAELVREGLFQPDAYVRQLLCNGVLDLESTTVDPARVARHRHVLQNLPPPPRFLLDDGTVNDPSLSEAYRIYRNERRSALYGLGKRLNLVSQEPGFAARQLHKEGSRNWAGLETKQSSGLHGTMEGTFQRSKCQRRKWKITDLKQLIATSLLLPEACVAASIKPLETKASRGILNSLKRPAALAFNSKERDPTPGCEECSKSKRLKTIEGKGLIMAIGDEEDTWWSKKGPKVVEPIKVVEAIKAELPVKPLLKQSRGRPKAVRKTQSLAQLAATRTESTQGASSSHLFDTKVSCPHHQPSPDGVNILQTKDSNKVQKTADLHSIGAAMKCLRVGENRSIVRWLDSLVRSLVSSGGYYAPSVHANGFPDSASVLEQASMVQWRIGDEQLALIVLVMDSGNDLHTLLQLLLWLLPIAAIPPANPPGHVGRGIGALSGSKESSMCDVGEAVVLSCLRRYEGVLAAMDLLPQALSAGMKRAANVMAAGPGGQAGCSALLCYVRDLLRKYRSLASVQAWEKSWKTTCDQRLGAELEALKAGDTEGGFGMVGGMGDDRDDPNLPRLTGRLERVGKAMKDIILRGMNEAMHSMVNKERDLAASSAAGADLVEDGYLAAQRVVGGIMDSIRQNGGVAPQADSALVTTAVTTVVGNAWAAVATVLDTLGYSNTGANIASIGPAIRCGRRVLQMHVYCLQLLKDALGERQTRMLEVALATEASMVVTNGVGHSPGRPPRSQFHLSPETPESNSALANDVGGSPGLGRAPTAAAAVAALVASLVVNGITSLERMVSVLRIKDGLENLQLLKSGGPTSNGMSRVGSMGSNAKADTLAEANIYWFRVLIGDCRTVAGGLVADLLGESTVLGLAHMQRAMPLTAVFPPAYAIFAAALHRNQPAYNTSNKCEDLVAQAVTVAVNDMVAFEPFRDVCLRDTRALYLLLLDDTGESEYAAMLDIQGLELNKKILAIVPLRARLFLYALLDRKMSDDDIWGQGQTHTSTEPGQVEQLVRVLDELQAATFHWQWVELRLLLNEQVVLERLNSHSQSAQEAVQAAMAVTDRQLAECEKTFTEVVLTRLLVRPEAAALYSEAVHSLGRQLEEYLILQVKWVLEGPDVLAGRKSLCQLLERFAVRQGFSVNSLHRIKPWGWQPPKPKACHSLDCDDRKQSSQHGASPEEGEVEDDGMEWKKPEEKQTRQGLTATSTCKPFASEKALADLVLPCLVRSSNDTCSGFAFELVKQLSNLEQQISSLSRSSGRAATTAAPGGEAILGPKGPGGRRGGRTGLDVGSPGMGRRSTVSLSESTPASAAGLQISVWLRLQFLLPLLPVIQTEREQQSGRNMRQTLAIVLLRLLGTRVVQEAAEPVACAQFWESSVSTSDFERNAEAAAASAGEALFDRLLSVLHALLSSTWAVWLKHRPLSKGPIKPLRDIPAFDREVVERMQADVEHMQVSAGVRARLFAAMPLLLPQHGAMISAASPQVPSGALALLQGSISNTLSSSLKGNLPLETSLAKAKGVSTVVVDPELEVDAWTALEDGVGAVSGPIGGGEVGNLKANALLKGAVRVRRSPLTYVGAVDDDS